MSRLLPVSEVFGPTIQGEGPHAGRRVYFVRLGGCNLSCSWCDSAYTWDGETYDLREELTPSTALDVLARLHELGWDGDAPVVLTGGEPLLYQRFPEFVELLALVPEVHVETNGTILPTHHTIANVAHFSTSPKLAHAGTHRGRSAEPAAGWDRVAETVPVAVKVVVQTPADCDTAAALVDSMGLTRSHLWLMPEGITAEVLGTRWRMVCDQALRLHANATHRLHVLAYGDIRGV